MSHCIFAVILMLTLAGHALADPFGPRAVFVIGAPGRLDAAGDERQPRRYQRADSAIGAYADVEIVQDPTWLDHEIGLYVRRTANRAAIGVGDSERSVRRLGRAVVIAVTAGTHAEVVWRCARNTAVRLAWQRIVVTPTGTMTVDAPPAEFAAALLAEFPSRTHARDLASAGDAAWALNEVDRLLYYADQVADALPALPDGAQRRRAVRFVEDNLAEIGHLRALYLDGPEAQEPAAVGDALSQMRALPCLADQLAAIRAWRTGADAPRWCTAALGWSCSADF